jgi:hypothetical protein
MMKLIATSVWKTKPHGYLFAPPTKKLKSITWFPSGITGNPPKNFYHIVPTGYHRKK